MNPLVEAVVGLQEAREPPDAVKAMTEMEPKVTPATADILACLGVADLAVQKMSTAVERSTLVPETCRGAFALLVSLEKHSTVPRAIRAIIGRTRAPVLFPALRKSKIPVPDNLLPPAAATKSARMTATPAPAPAAPAPAPAAPAPAPAPARAAPATSSTPPAAPAPAPLAARASTSVSPASPASTASTASTATPSVATESMSKFKLVDGKLPEFFPLITVTSATADALAFHLEGFLADPTAMMKRVDPRLFVPHALKDGSGDTQEVSLSILDILTGRSDFTGFAAGFATPALLEKALLLIPRKGAKGMFLFCSLLSNFAAGKAFKKSGSWPLGAQVFEHMQLLPPAMLFESERHACTATFIYMIVFKLSDATVAERIEAPFIKLMLKVLGTFPNSSPVQIHGFSALRFALAHVSETSLLFDKFIPFNPTGLAFAAMIHFPYDAAVAQNALRLVAEFVSHSRRPEAVKTALYQMHELSFVPLLLGSVELLKDMEDDLVRIISFLFILCNVVFTDIKKRGSAEFFSNDGFTVLAQCILDHPTSLNIATTIIDVFEQAISNGPRNAELPHNSTLIRGLATIALQPSLEPLLHAAVHYLWVMCTEGAPLEIFKGQSVEKLICKGLKADQNMPLEALAVLGHVFPVMDFGAEKPSLQAALRPTFQGRIASSHSELLVQGLLAIVDVNPSAIEGLVGPADLLSSVCALLTDKSEAKSARHQFRRNILPKTAFMECLVRILKEQSPILSFCRQALRLLILLLEDKTSGAVRQFKELKGVPAIAVVMKEHPSLAESCTRLSSLVQ